MADGRVIIETDLETKKFEVKMQKLQNRLEQQTNKSGELRLKLEEVNQELASMGNDEIGTKQWEKLVNQAVALEDQLAKSDTAVEEIKSQVDLLNFEKIQNDAKKTGTTLENISNKMSKIVKQGVKWGLAIFSVRTAYTIASRAAQSYLNINEELSNRMQSIWTGLGSFLEPILTSVSNILLKGVAILNHFVKALTGVDYVARANAKSLNAQVKAQKSLNKEMAVFDEMSKVGSLDAGGIANAGSQIELPTLSQDTMNTIEQVAERVQEVIGIFSEWKTAWDELGISISPIVLLLGVGGLIGILTGKGGLVLGIGALVLGIQGLIKIFDEDLTASVEGLMLLLGSAGLIGILTGKAGLALAIGAVSTALFALNEIINGDTTEAIEGMILLLGSAGLIGILTGKTGLVMAITSVYLILQGLSDLFSGDATDSVKGFIAVVTGSGGLIITLSLMKGGLTAVLTPLNIATLGFVALAAGIVAVTKNWGQMTTLEKVVSVLGLIAAGAAAAAVAVGALQSAWSAGLAAAAIVAGTVAIAAAVSNANKRAQENVPKLAVGGIVNVPGRGVPIGGAIAGEAGAEGVIPLTDSQAMETLGQAIGKYITINANITNTMNGRVISRELQKINTNSDFARNS